jgi:tryptophan synthase beta subunit
MTYSSDVPDARGHFGTYGGRFVPEALVAALDELTAAYEKCRHDQAFQAELAGLHATYTGRPSPVTDARRFAEHAGGARVLLKREDLNHTGSHKINNVLGQALLTRRVVSCSIDTYSPGPTRATNDPGVASKVIPSRVGFSGICDIGGDSRSEPGIGRPRCFLG